MDENICQWNDHFGAQVWIYLTIRQQKVKTQKTQPDLDQNHHTSTEN